MDEKNTDEIKKEDVNQEKLNNMIKEGDIFKTLFTIVWALLMILPIALYLYNSSMTTI